MDKDDSAMLIYEERLNPMEVYLAENFIGHFSCCFRRRYFFLQADFMNALDTMTDSGLTQLLEYFEENNFELPRVYKESKNNFKTLFDDEIRSGRMKSFKEFLEYKEPK
jgi:hypothetical protein